MTRRFLHTAAALVVFSGFGHALPPEYNGAGRDMYGNTAAQNDAIQLRGTEEKARFARETTSQESSENDARLQALVPGAILLTVLVVTGAVVYRTRR